jgi:hypothetical protein
VALNLDQLDPATRRLVEQQLGLGGGGGKGNAGRKRKRTTRKSVGGPFAGAVCTACGASIASEAALERHSDQEGHLRFDLLPPLLTQREAAT